MVLVVVGAQRPARDEPATCATPLTIVGDKLSQPDLHVPQGRQQARLCEYRRREYLLTRAALQYQAFRVNAQAIDVMLVSAAVLAGWGLGLPSTAGAPLRRRRSDCHHMTVRKLRH